MNDHNASFETLKRMMTREDKDSEDISVRQPLDSKEGEEEDSKVQRETWSTNKEFMLSCIGCCIGLGNIWRFPYLCYKNGGGAFLIPYLVCLFTCGVPMLILEGGLGQYMSRGSLGVWNICPAFKGIGISAMVKVFFLNLYYIVVLAWGIFYLYHSFSTVLPWASCDNSWNTNRCYVGVQSLANTTNVTMVFGNGTPPSSDNFTQTVDSVVEFWEHGVLQISEGIDKPGTVVPGLAISLLIAWVLVYFCIWGGIKWTGKVVYFTALFPYVVIFCLVIRGVTLEGASEGLKFYLKPDLSRLTDPQVWVDGGTQIFFSYCLVTGDVLTLSSYNKFNFNFVKYFLTVALINASTSIIGGVAVFSALGFMAKQQNVSVADVADSGPGLIFLAYPKAISQMPVPNLWSVLFFLMIFFVGVDCQFVLVEAFVTPLIDTFPHALKGLKKRMLIAAVYCSVLFLLGLALVTQGGMYVFQVFDYYSCSGLVLLWACFFEAIAIAWVFGKDKYLDAVEHMIGRPMPFRLWFGFSWQFLTPVITMAIFVFMLIDFKPLTYNRIYEYPWPAQVFGISLALVSMVCIPAVFFAEFLKAKGTVRQRWCQISQPKLQDHQIPESFYLKTNWNDSTF